MQESQCFEELQLFLLVETISVHSDRLYRLSDTLSSSLRVNEISQSGSASGTSSKISSWLAYSDSIVGIAKTVGVYGSVVDVSVNSNIDAAILVIGVTASSKVCSTMVVGTLILGFGLYVRLTSGIPSNTNPVILGYLSSVGCGSSLTSSVILCESLMCWLTPFWDPKILSHWLHGNPVEVEIDIAVWVVFKNGLFKLK